MSAESPIRVRITSDGTPGGTRIVDAESGRKIACASATWTMGAGDPPRLTIVVLDFEIEASRTVTS